MDLIFPDRTEAFAQLVSGLDSAIETGTSVELLATIYPPSEITRRIDEDTAYLDELSRILKARRNDLAPVLSLPPEVMGSIIELCARIEPPQARPAGPARRTSRGRKALQNSSIHESLGWVRMGHICQRLRGVVLGMPALWAAITFSLPKGHEEILARAQNAPLTVELLRPLFPELPKRTASRLLLAKRIELDFDVPRVRDLWSSLTASEPTTEAFTLLENLSIADARLVENITTSSMSATSILRAPRLRHLKLQNYFVSCNFSSLETLELDFNLNVPVPVEAIRRAAIFEWAAVREVLSRCTNLSRLAFNGTQFGILPSPSSERAALSLPALKHLRLHTPLAFCHSVWSDVIIRPETQIDVRLYNIDAAFDSNAADSAAEEMAFIIMLLNRLSAPSMPMIIGVRLECRVNIETRLVLVVKSPGAFTIEHQGPLAEGCEYILDVRVGRHNLHRTFDAPALFVQLLEELPKHIDLAHLETLALHLPRLQGYPAVPWCTSLAPYSMVHNLILDELPVQRSLWDALCPAPDSAAGLALPNITALFVLPDQSMAFDIPGIADREQLVPWEDIPNGFRLRAEPAVAIQRIVFGMSARIESERVLDELMTVVPQVVDTRESKGAKTPTGYDSGDEFFFR